MSRSPLQMSAQVQSIYLLGISSEELQWKNKTACDKVTAVGDTGGRGLWRQNKHALIEVPGKEASLAPLLTQKCCPAFIMEMYNLWGKD